MIELLETQRVRSRAQLASVERLVLRSDAASFDEAPAGKWSAREHIAHLARHLEVFLERLELILTAERPVLSRYRAEEDPEWPEWRTLPRETLLARISESKKRLDARLAASDQADVTRIGVHPAHGEMTLVEWLDFQLDHEAHHLYQMRALLKRAR